MMRANLLPRPAPKFGLFGLPLDARRARSVALALSCIVLAGAATGAVERFRLQALETELSRQSALAAANGARRTQVRRLALEIAHLQDVRAAATALRRSGNDVALQIARAGNAVPTGVWLDRLAATPTAFELGGESVSIEAAGSAAASLERSFPKSRAVLTDVHRRDDERFVFAADLELSK